MAILVTGSGGLIGTRFFEQFSGKLDLIPGDLKNGFDILDSGALVDKTKQDLQGRSLDAIVHLAAFTDVSQAFLQSDDEAALCYQLNVVGTRNVTELAAHFGAHLVHVSTDFVFDGESDAPLTERTKPNPIEWYGETKLIAENVVTSGDASWTIIRISFPYLKARGIRPDLVAGIREKLSKRESLNLFADQLITPTFIDDITSAIDLFVEKKPNGELFHVTGPESITPFDLGMKIAHHEGETSPAIVATSLVDYLQQDPRPRHQQLQMDSSKYQEWSRNHLGCPLRRVSDVFPPQSKGQ